MRTLMKMFMLRCLGHLDFSAKNTVLFFKNFIILIFIVSISLLIISCATSQWTSPSKIVIDYPLSASKIPLHVGLDLSNNFRDGVPPFILGKSIQLGENLSINAEKMTRALFSEVTIVNDANNDRKNLDAILVPTVVAVDDDSASNTGTAFSDVHTTLVLKWTLKMENNSDIIPWEKTVKGKGTGHAGNIYTVNINTRQRVEMAIEGAFKNSFALMSTDELGEIIKLNHSHSKMWDKDNGEHYVISFIPTVLADTKNKYYFSKILEYSLKQNWNNLLKILIANNIPLDAQFDADDYYPLHIAAKNNNVEAIDILASAGCNVNAKDSAGHLPIYYADINNYSDSLKKLLVLNSESDTPEQDDEIRAGKKLMELGDFCTSIWRKEAAKDYYSWASWNFYKSSSQFTKMLSANSWDEMLDAMIQAAKGGGYVGLIDPEKLAIFLNRMWKDKGVYQTSTTNKGVYQISITTNNKLSVIDTLKMMKQIMALKGVHPDEGVRFYYKNLDELTTWDTTYFKTTIQNKHENISDDTKNLMKELEDEAYRNFKISMTKLTVLEGSKNFNDFQKQLTETATQFK
jgi:hypothetical protein